MFEIKKGFFKILPVVLFVFQVSAEAPQGKSRTPVFMDPEVQFYFENTIGYRKLEKSRNGGFRDSPVSVPSGGELLKPALAAVSRTAEVQPSAAEYKKTNFDAFPLYYDLKASNKPGPISSCVLEPSDEQEPAASGYVLVDIAIKSDDAPAFYGDFMKKIDFFLAGEQDMKEGAKSWKIVFGWISHGSMETLRTSRLIKGFSFSARSGIRAPLKEVSLIIKAPVNRDYSVFSKAFVEEIKKFGFEEKSSENISSGRGSRFSLMKITGRLPVDRIEPLLSNPFVLKISSNL